MNISGGGDDDWRAETGNGREGGLTFTVATVAACEGTGQL